MVKVLFVCLGNICRSPTAEGVFRKIVEDAKLDSVISIDSCGTSATHAGDEPDPRSQRHALKRGYDLSSLRARQLTKDDFTAFDYIFAMDESNLRNINRVKPSNSTAVIDLFLKRYHCKADEVPDPYYDGAAGFEHVLDLLEDGCRKLLADLKKGIAAAEPAAAAAAGPKAKV